MTHRLTSADMSTWDTMMRARYEALNAMADLPAPSTANHPFTGIEVPLADYLEGHVTEAALGGIPDRLAEAITDRLVRAPGSDGAGAVLVTGLSRYIAPPAVRAFHETLFRQVWERMNPRCGAESPGDRYRIKVGVTADGAIPLDLYGSAWSFKQLHMDRDALLFSHLYGPVAGFTGGSLLLADIRGYMSRHGLRFEDLFAWSVEPTPGSKPVLRAEHERSVMESCGVEVGPLGPDQIVFVNNLPSAGVLHGATPVTITDPGKFVREYHRCNAKALS